MKRTAVLILGVFFLLSVLPGFGAVKARMDRSFNSTLEITFPAPRISTLTIDGKPAVALSLPDTAITLERGEPELPVLHTLVMVAPDKDPELEITNRAFHTLDLSAPLLPSRGNLSRSVDPNKVPFTFGDIYEKDVWIPSDKDMVQMGKPFIFRDVRGVRVTTFPVQYNPIKNQLRVFTSVTLKINRGSKGGTNIKKGNSRISPLFDPLYRSAFANYTPMTSSQRLPRLGENGRLLVIAPDAFYNAVLPLVVWKLKCGIETRPIRLSEIGGPDANAIKEFLQGEFNENGFTHVILVGDADQLPPLKGVNEGADSDPCYVKLAGDDNVPDAIISRISATTPEEVAYQVAKFITYEQFPTTGAEAAWYTKAMGVASEEGNPPDWERMDILRNALLKARFTSVDSIYKKAVSSPGSGNPGYPGYPDYPGTPGFPGYPGFPGGPHPHLPPMMDMARAQASRSSLKEDVADGVNAGRSLINYIGHGSKTTWVTSGFAVEDCRNLKNGGKLPLIISVACVNGDFTKGTDCLAEAWLKAGDIENHRGAVGFFGSTTNQDWVPPCVVQGEIVTNYLVNDTYRTAGGMVTNGIMKGLEEYGVENTSPGVKMMEQWHWFGDGTNLIRTTSPIAVRATATCAFSEGQGKGEIVVTDEAGKPLANARTTIYSADLAGRVTGLTDEQGKFPFALAATDQTGLFLTVIDGRIVPIVDQKIQ